jgi:sulfate transport system substrate-binding protein
VLISFESEVNNIRKQYEAQGFEVVIPKTNILAEFPVAWVDKNVQPTVPRKRRKPISTTVQPAGADHHHRLLLPREQPGRDEQTER